MAAPADVKEEALPEIDPLEITIGDKIGSGSFSKVFKGTCRGKAVAVKVLNRQKYTKEDLDAFREEVKIMSKIFHPNIVLFMGACTIPGKLMMVTELMPMDLETLLLAEKTEIPLIQKIRMAKDAALGINWLHCSNPMFIHRDLKLSNLLVSDDLKVKVCDFGLTKMKQRGTESLEYSPQGSPLYMAPEVFIGDYNEKCDVYSFGIILWEMLTQQQVFAEFEDNLMELVKAVLDRDQRPAIPADCPPSLSALMEQCWARDPAQRPSFKQIIPKLDEIIVDCAVYDPEGNCFWKTHFFGQEIVPWSQFASKLSKFLRLSENHARTDITFKCLKAVLAEENKSELSRSDPSQKWQVSLERFGKLLGWFGPLIEPPTADANAPSNAPPVSRLLQRIKDTLLERWFHGDVATAEAEDRLNGQKGGTFLIRFSSSPSCYTISSVTKKKTVIHQRILHVPGEGFYFWEERYDDLKTLVAKEASKHYLKHPCPGSKFARLFEPKRPLPGKDVPHGYLVPTGAGAGAAAAGATGLRRSLSGSSTPKSS